MIIKYNTDKVKSSLAKHVIFYGDNIQGIIIIINIKKKLLYIFKIIVYSFFLDTALPLIKVKLQEYMPESIIPPLSLATSTPKFAVVQVYIINTKVNTVVK